jgi:hypothetical protein
MRKVITLTSSLYFKNHWSIDDNLRNHSSILMSIKPKLGGFTFQLARPFLTKLKFCIVICLLQLAKFLLTESITHLRIANYLSVNYQINVGRTERGELL